MTEYGVEDFQGRDKTKEHPHVDVLLVQQALFTGQHKTYFLIFIYDRYQRSLFFSPSTKRFTLGFEYISAEFLISFIHGQFEIFRITHIHQINFEQVLTHLKDQLAMYHVNGVDLEPLIEDGGFMEAFQRELKVLHGLELPKTFAEQCPADVQGTSEEELGRIIANILITHKDKLTPALQTYAEKHGIVLE